MKINTCFKDLNDNYLFSTISHKVENYKKAHPCDDIISLGIGDVTRPLAPAITQAMHQAVTEMEDEETFHGYGEEQGYHFLREAVVSYYKQKNITLVTDEIFISDGAKSDIGNILDIFAKDNQILIPDPVYPVYVDTNIMAGRSISYMKGNKENNFLPLPDEHTKGDIVYLCSPNNPTGSMYDHKQLQTWVTWSIEHNAVLLFDSAYEAFIEDPSKPVSIYEIEGAKDCAIEFCSLSKTAGFTGVRCGYTIVPLALHRENTSLRDLWLRRQTTKFNGVSYIVQRGAQAVFTDEGQAQIQKDIQAYMENAKLIHETLTSLNIWHCGGVNSPYIWFACPRIMKSWDFFDHLLASCQIVGTPGIGFGTQGEGYFRFSAFGNHEKVKEAMSRFMIEFQ